MGLPVRTADQLVLGWLKGGQLIGSPMAVPWSVWELVLTRWFYGCVEMVQLVCLLKSYSWCTIITIVEQALYDHPQGPGSMGYPQRVRKVDPH